MRSIRLVRAAGSRRNSAEREFGSAGPGGEDGRMSRRGWILFATMCVIWGVPYLLIKVAVEDLAPATLVLARTGLGALVLLPIAVLQGQVGALRRVWRPLAVYT